MKKYSKILSFLFSMFSIMCFTVLAVPALGNGALVVSVAGYLYSISPESGNFPIHTIHSEVIKKLFTSDLQERLYPNNAFYTEVQVDTDISDTGGVEIPQDEDGEIPVHRNPKKFPLETIVEEDKKKSYQTDFLATPPQLVTLDNQLLVSYDKRTAKLRKHENQLRKEIAETILHGWSPTVADYIRKTTGSTNRPGSLNPAQGVKRIALEDWIWAEETMNELDIPAEGRRAVITPKQKTDLALLGKDFIKASDLIEQGIWTKGSIGRVFGFDIFMRSETQAYSTDATPIKRAIDAELLATDTSAALFYHPMFVRRTEDNIKVYMDTYERGEMLGKTMNASVRIGATQSRLSETGVLTLVEGLQ